MDWLILDLDGVLRRWDPEIVGAAERAATIPPGSLAAVAFAAPLLERAITGVMTDRSWRAAVSAELVRRHGGRAAQAVRDWSASAGEVDLSVLELVRERRRHGPVALLSNATSRLAADLEALGLTSELDRVFNSSELGLTKPDPAVFTRVARELGTEAARCSFVDDSPANVTAAAGVGMRAHRFTGVPGLRRFLGAAQ